MYPDAPFGPATLPSHARAHSQAVAHPRPCRALWALLADWIAFFFSYTFAAAASTIVSGAVAERCQIAAYLIYTCVITGFIYPTVVHWVWDPTGMLSAFNPNHILGGNIDFAGSGVVHMTGGVAGLVGAWVLGPRIGRWERPSEFEGHSTPLQIIGTFLLWFGWYGFNGGSTLVLHTYGRDMARVAVTTTISAATSGWFGLLIKKFLPKAMGGTGVYDVGHTCNSILGGLVGITAGCSTISAPGALATGFISAWVYHGGSCLARKLKVDDPLDAFAVHGACGFWGVMAVAFFCVPEYSYAPNSANPAYGTGYDAGVFTGRGDGRLFGAQVPSHTALAPTPCARRMHRQHTPAAPAGSMRTASPRARPAVPSSRLAVAVALVWSWSGLGLGLLSRGGFAVLCARRSSLCSSRSCGSAPSRSSCSTRCACLACSACPRTLKWLVSTTPSTAATPTTSTRRRRSRRKPRRRWRRRRPQPPWFNVLSTDLGMPAATPPPSRPVTKGRALAFSVFPLSRSTELHADLGKLCRGEACVPHPGASGCVACRRDVC